MAAGLLCNQAASPQCLHIVFDAGPTSSSTHTGSFFLLLTAGLSDIYRGVSDTQNF